MSRKTTLQTIATLLVIAIITTAVYFFPPVHERFAWRVNLVLTYIRGIVDPIEAMPTALAPQTEAAIAAPPPSPTPTRTLAPSPTKPGPTATPLPTPTPIPGSVALPQPAYELQDWNNCGPATLAMYLRHYGWDGDQYDIADVVKPLREDRNVNVEELVYYVRNHAGWLNIEFRVGGTIEDLKRYLAAGIPVMIEEGTQLEKKFWPSDDMWAGHYLLLTGYDDTAQHFNMIDSYHQEIKTTSYEHLEENWQAFNHVYILVYRPEQAETVKSLMGEDVDIDANRQKALEQSLAAAEADPGNAYAWFNVGSNYVYFEEYGEAARAYDKAREIGLPQRMLLYQFGPYFAYFHTMRIDELMTSTEYILELPSRPESEEAHLWHGWGLFRQGDRVGAREEFMTALEDNPLYLDAQYALEFLANNP